MNNNNNLFSVFLVVSCSENNVRFYNKDFNCILIYYYNSCKKVCDYFLRNKVAFVYFI